GLKLPGRRPPAGTVQPEALNQGQPRSPVQRSAQFISDSRPAAADPPCPGHPCLPGRVAGQGAHRAPAPRWYPLPGRPGADIVRGPPVSWQWRGRAPPGPREGLSPPPFSAVASPGSSTVFRRAGTRALARGGDVSCPDFPTGQILPSYHLSP